MNNSINFNPKKIRPALERLDALMEEGYEFDEAFAVLTVEQDLTDDEEIEVKRCFL